MKSRPHPRKTKRPRTQVGHPRALPVDHHRSDADRRLRLSKFLSDTGVASRRHAEKLILAGRVTVADEVVNTLPAFLREGDVVMLDGRVVRPLRHEYWIVHKPRGFVCTHNDPSGRRRAVDLLPVGTPRVFPVGRLEIESTGLLLLTNDGDLAERLTHPRFGVPKVYRVEVAGRVGRDLPAAMREGFWLSDGKARALSVETIHLGRDCSVLNVTLVESRNRQLYRMFAHCGHKVRKLSRVSIGPLQLRGLPLGAARMLSHREVESLFRAAEQSRARGGASGAMKRVAGAIANGQTND